VSGTEAKPERVALSRDLSEFLVDLSIALHRHSMYPSGHPSLEPVVASVLRRAERLLRDRSTIAFGVARRQLIIEGVSTDPDQPVLRRLAEGLHRHHLGAISLSRGVQIREISEALRELAREAEQDAPLGLQEPGAVPQWPHLTLHPLSFSKLTLVEDAGPASSAATRGAELWVGLARAAMSAEQGAEAESVPDEPSVVARAINDHPKAEAYDQVIVGYLLQIARELTSASGEEAAGLRRRTSTLIAALRPETLRRLVEMGGDAAQRRAFVADATHGMAVDAVLEIVKAAADATHQTISHGLLRMLSKLAVHAETGSDTTRPLADAALREQVGRLLADWHLEDPNPEAYGRVLQHLATTAPIDSMSASTAAQALGPSDLLPDRGDPMRLAKMAFEAGGSGPLLDRAVERVMRHGQVSELLELLSTRPAGGDAVAEAVLSRLLHPAALASLVAREPIDIASLDSLLPFMSAESYELLLDALASSESRTTRRKLLDRVAHSALDLSLSITARLEDERWYVQRNMLLLLERMGRIPTGFSPERWTAHPDARVRYEAVRFQLGLPHERDMAVRAALEDADPRVVRLGLTAVQQDCLPMYAARVARIATAPESDDEVRLLAVSTLGHLRQVQALQALLHIVDGGRTLLGRPRLAPTTQVVLVALEGLANLWATDPRAAVWLARARESPDDDVRRAAHPSGQP
jgi:hypothetical protein